MQGSLLSTVFFCAGDSPLLSLKKIQSFPAKVVKKTIDEKIHTAKKY
jgi:hypothetical protein